MNDVIISAITANGDRVIKSSYYVKDETILKLEEIVSVIAANGGKWDVSVGALFENRPYQMYKDRLSKEQIDLFFDYKPMVHIGIVRIESIILMIDKQQKKIL